MKANLEHTLIDSVKNRVKTIEDQILSMHDSVRAFKDDIAFLKARGMQIALKPQTSKLSLQTLMASRVTKMDFTTTTRYVY